jgi:Tfp pilus assembly protein PilN
MTVLNINLIAGRRRQKQRTATVVRAAFYSVVGLCALGVLVYLEMVVAAQQVRGGIDTIQAELSSPGTVTKMARVALLEKETQELTPRVQLLEKVHTSEAEWIGILYDISARIPQNVWLGQMTTQRTDKQQTIALKGRALRQAEIGAFMLALNEPAWSNSAALTFAQAAQDGRSGSTAVEFEITVPLKSVIGGNLK